MLLVVLLLRSSFFSLMIPPPPSSTLFPYTTLFRSVEHADVVAQDLAPPDLVERLELGRVVEGPGHPLDVRPSRSEEHTSELQSRRDLVCRLLLEKKKNQRIDLSRTLAKNRRDGAAP